MTSNHMHQWQETCAVGSRKCLICGIVVTFDHREEQVPSINDWASKAAEHIDEEFVTAKHRPSVERIAAIIATFAKPLIEALDASRRQHHHEEDDSWYCCGACTHPCDSDEMDHEHDKSCCVESTTGRVQGKCNCGADEHNARINRALQGEKS